MWTMLTPVKGTLLYRNLLLRTPRFIRTPVVQESTSSRKPLTHQTHLPCIQGYDPPLLCLRKPYNILSRSQSEPMGPRLSRLSFFPVVIGCPTPLEHTRYHDLSPLTLTTLPYLVRSEAQPSRPLSCSYYMKEPCLFRVVLKATPHPHRPLFTHKYSPPSLILHKHPLRDGQEDYLSCESTYCATMLLTP